MLFKSWTKLFFKLVTLFFMLIIPLNYIVNPYSIFNHEMFTSFFKVKEHIVSARMKEFYTVKHKNPKSIIMGSSRIEMFHQDIFNKYLGDKSYKLAMPGSNIEEQSQYLIYMINNFDIKNIIWSLDFFSFNPDLPNDKDFTYNRLSEPFYLNDDYKIALLSLQTTKNSFKTIIDNIKIVLNKSLVKDPIITKQEGYNNYLKSTLKEIQQRTNIQLQYYPMKFLKYSTFNKPDSINKNISKVQKVLQLCKSKNIKVYIYTSPVQASFLNLYKTIGLDKTFTRWKSKLTKITNYTDFATYNSITNKQINFIDGTHIMTSFGPMIFAKVFNDTSINVPEDFGIKKVNTQILNTKNTQ